jgi:hypothetical protein
MTEHGTLVMTWTTRYPTLEPDHVWVIADDPNRSMTFDFPWDRPAMVGSIRVERGPINQLHQARQAWLLARYRRQRQERTKP